MLLDLCLNTLFLVFLGSWESSLPTAGWYLTLIKTRWILVLGQTKDSDSPACCLRPWPKMNASKKHEDRSIHIVILCQMCTNFVLGNLQSKSWWLGVYPYPTDFTFTCPNHARIVQSSMSPPRCIFLCLKPHDRSSVTIYTLLFEVKEGGESWALLVPQWYFKCTRRKRSTN